MSDRDWFELPANPLSRDWQNNRVTNWIPGDGLLCSAAGKQRDSATRCSAPMAVHESWGSKWGTQRGVTRRVICGTHLADLVRYLTREVQHAPTVKVEAQRVAKEQVLAAHWDEYQDAVAAHMERIKDEAFVLLPEWMVRPAA